MTTHVYKRIPFQFLLLLKYVGILFFKKGPSELSPLGPLLRQPFLPSKQPTFYSRPITSIASKFKRVSVANGFLVPVLTSLIV
jgi:hypothetical protein